jgi:hypothetical protein
LTVYNKTVWADNETPISAANMNKIETGIGDAHDTLNAATSAATPDVIVKRDANGRMKAVAPAASDDVALKSTVDTHAAITTAPVHGSTSAATPNTLAHRDANGQFNVGTPTADTHTATKVYADNLSKHIALSDDVLLSKPDEVGNNGGGVGFFHISKPGRYRLKGEIQSGTNGSSAGFDCRFGLVSAGNLTADSVSGASTTSSTYSSFSIDLPYIPGHCRMLLYASSGTTCRVRNLTLCGVEVVGDQDVLS